MATRTERALAGTITKPPPHFQHSVTPGQPTPPSVVLAGRTAPAVRDGTIYTLDQADSDRFNRWLVEHATGGGAETAADYASMTPELQTVIAAFNDYFASSAYHTWSITDEVSRDMQWRLLHVDVITALDTAATVPVSSDPAGVGTPAPGVGEIINSGGSGYGPTESVTSGGPTSELVFGDDGTMVTI